jgi:prepilin-type processing-associated H-X9-DG protein
MPSGFSYSDVILLVDKWPQATEWHLDVDSGPEARDQWYSLIFNTTVTGTTVKKKYKHGKSGNNYLFLDFSVRNQDPGYRADWQWAPHQCQDMGFGPAPKLTEQ